MKIVKAIEEKELGGGVSRIRIDLDNGLTILVMNGNEVVHLMKTAEFEHYEKTGEGPADADYAEIQRS